MPAPNQVSAEIELCTFELPILQQEAAAGIQCQPGCASSQEDIALTLGHRYEQLQPLLPCPLEVLYQFINLELDALFFMATTVENFSISKAILNNGINFSSSPLNSWFFLAHSGAEQGDFCVTPLLPRADCQLHVWGGDTESEGTPKDHGGPTPGLDSCICSSVGAG